jgi:hypothetical protein
LFFFGPFELKQAHIKVVGPPSLLSPSLFLSHFLSGPFRKPPAHPSSRPSNSRRPAPPSPSLTRSPTGGAHLSGASPTSNRPAPSHGRLHFPSRSYKRRI